MSPRACFFATLLLLAVQSRPADAQFIMGGILGGPPMVGPGASSFYFGMGPSLAPFGGFTEPLFPRPGFYRLAPARPSPSAEPLVMPPNADDLRLGRGAKGVEPGGADAVRDPADDDEALQAPRLRVANAESTARARQFIDYGDASFRRQEFARAYDRYRKAAESAPNLAEPYFRQALAQSAIGQFLPAVKTIRRGVAIDADWWRSEFRLEQLYASRAAKQAHFERLALTAGDEPQSADLMFLLGVELFFDGQADRAATFLHRAAELGLEAKLLQGFLNSAARRGKRRPYAEEL